MEMSNGFFNLAGVGCGSRVIEECRFGVLSDNSLKFVSSLIPAVPFLIQLVFNYLAG